jgi:PilZ domain
LDRQPPYEKSFKERRNFFRIEDDVLLRYVPIDQSGALANRVPAQFSEDPCYSLMRELQDIELENNNFLRFISDGNRDLGNYLKSINKKIDLIAATLANSLDPIPDHQSQRISLSEAGLSFCSHCELANDDYVAMQLTLKPTFVTLVLFAKIINCSEGKNGFNIALSFVHLNDNDRQMLAKHIMQLQLAAKRQRTIEKD